MLPLQKNLNFPIQFLALKIELALTSTFYPYVELSKIEVFMTQTLTSAFYPYVELSKIEVFMSQPPPSNETQPLEVIPCTYTYSDSLGISPDIVR